MRTARLLRHVARLGAASVLFSVITVAGPFTAGASPANSNCADPTPYKWLPPRGAVTTSQIDSAAAATIGQQKMAVDAQNPGLQADLQGARAASPNPAEMQKKISAARRALAVPHSNLSMDEACSNLGVKRGSLFERFRNSFGTTAQAAGSTTAGSGWAYLNFLNQQGQICTPTCAAQRPYPINYYCGPATISEGTTTVNVAVSQDTAANYMGMATDVNGTDTTHMTNGMVHFIGQPVFGWSFYGFQSVAYTATQADKDNFKAYLTYDINSTTAAPVAGDAYEEVGGPHLTGHPNQNIFHWFEIGGWDQTFGSPYSVYYADSATSVWSAVPQFSWYDMWTLVVILGGRGYIW